MKRTLALVLGLAAVLLFAPVARADFHDGKSPYRDLAGPLDHASDIQPAADENDHDVGDDHDGDANDGSHHDDGTDASDDHEDANDHDDDQANDHDDGDDNEGADDNPGSGSDTGNQPGTNPGTNPGGPTTQSVPGNPSLWLWVLLVVIAGAAVTTAYVVRRKMRAR